MRLIRPAAAADRRWALAVSLAMLLVGGAAVTVMALVPSGRRDAAAVLGLSAALGFGVGVAMLVRTARARSGLRDSEHLVRLLAPIFDDSYVLMVAPRLPGVSRDLAGLLVGPPGVRALIARQWHGRYRVRGRRWDYDTRSSDNGWIPCHTNPSFDADAVGDAVAHWAREAGEASLPLAPAIVFPRKHSSVLLEEPDGEIVTVDNAPWWGQRIGRVQRMDAARVARFAQAVIDAADVGPRPVRTAPQPEA
jgi:hypothetical protein